MIVLNDAQKAGLAKAEVWYNESADQVFRIFGYAGTGKTTIVKELTKKLGIDPLFGAYTGKAASVLRKMGNPAQTLHSLTYRPVFPDRLVIEQLKKDLEKAETMEEMNEISEALREANKMFFVLREDSDLGGCDALVLDECSMVDDKMANDIKSFGPKIIVLGDPGQLPPIEGKGAFIRDKPDVMLTEIHRQAEGNPIIELAFLARNGRKIKYQDYGESYMRRPSDVPMSHILGADQIITGKNETRRGINRQVRAELGLVGDFPVPGDKLICLKNSPQYGLWNGSICTLVQVHDDLGNLMLVTIKTDEDQEVKLTMHKGHFMDYLEPDWTKKAGWHELNRGVQFDWGYAITAHKAQGSQWDTVVIYDDNILMWKYEERKKWLYTAITRAVERVRIISA